jgi:hypothetical protein
VYSRHGVSQAVLQRIDIDLCCRRGPDLLKLWQHAAQGARPPGIDRGIRAAADRDLTKDRRLLQARVVEMRGHSPRCIRMHHDGPKSRGDPLPALFPERNRGNSVTFAIDRDLVEGDQPISPDVRCRRADERCGICLHDARIHGEPLALDEAHPHRGYDDARENMAQDVALTEPVQPVLGERRVVGNRVIEIKPAEPPVCEVEPHLLAQLPLGPDAEAVADDKHPDQQLGIDRRPADVAVEMDPTVRAGRRAQMSRKR